MSLDALDPGTRLGSPVDPVAWERMSTGLHRETDVSSVCRYDESLLGTDQVHLVADEHDGARP